MTLQCESLCVASVGAALDVTVKYPKTCPPRLMTFAGTAHRRFAASTWCGPQPCARSHCSAANLSLAVANSECKINSIFGAESTHLLHRFINLRRENRIGPAMSIIDFSFGRRSGTSNLLADRTGPGGRRLGNR